MLNFIYDKYAFVSTLERIINWTLKEIKYFTMVATKLMEAWKGCHQAREYVMIIRANRVPMLFWKKMTTYFWDYIVRRKINFTEASGTILNFHYLATQ